MVYVCVYVRVRIIIDVSRVAFQSDFEGRSRRNWIGSLMGMSHPIRKYYPRSKTHRYCKGFIMGLGKSAKAIYATVHTTFFWRKELV